MESEVAVVHDGAINPGGAVNVAIETARALDGDLYVGFSGMDEEWWDERAPNTVRILTGRHSKSFVQDLRVARLMVNLDIPEYETVVTSGPTAKFFQPHGDQRHVHYLHHPPLRLLWFDGGLFDYAMKTVDRIETNAIPEIIANSDLTARRVRNHYARTVDAVVNPPVDVNRFGGDRTNGEESVVLLGRLEYRKRTQLAIDAWTQMDRNGDTVPTLHVVGDGPLRNVVESSSCESVKYHGYASDDEVTDLLSRSKYGLFLAKEEDFGIVPVEFLAAGNPVVAVDEPNTNNQVTDGETGVLVEPTTGSVVSGVEQAIESTWDRGTIRSAAQTYSVDRFHEEIRDFIDE